MNERERETWFSVAAGSGESALSVQLGEQHRHRPLPGKPQTRRNEWHGAAMKAPQNRARKHAADDAHHVPRYIDISITGSLATRVVNGQNRVNVYVYDPRWRRDKE